MTNAQCVLIDLLRKSLFNFDINIPEYTDWQAVYDEANFQAVIPLAFDGTAGIDGIPEDIYKKFKNHTVAVMLNNDKVIKGQQELTALLEKNKVQYAILKGLSVARYYPKPELRTLGDVDFLVSKDDFDSTKQLLIDNGYVLTEDELNHFHCAFRKNDVTFELHFEMSEFPNTEVCNNLRKELERATEHTAEYEYFGIKFRGLNLIYQTFSLLLHMERHLFHEGLGLRQLIDWGMFCTKQDCLENESIRNILNDFGLYRFADTCIKAYSEIFLDASFDDSNISLIIDLLIENGNFGIKLDEEDIYVNKELYSGFSKLNFFNWFRYFKYRSSKTWPLAKKHPCLQNLAFIYLPIRYLFRVLFKKKNTVDIKKIKSKSNEIGQMFSELQIFENND